MPVNVQDFKRTLGPNGDHLHVVALLREEMHAAQLWVSSFLDSKATVRHTLPGFRAVALRCPAEALPMLERRPEVSRLLPDERVVACLEHTLEAARVQPLWEEGLTGKGVRLAILDTGIDRGHPDFEGRILAAEDFTGRGVRDDVGHGTHVASVAAGSGEASRGRYRGVAPAASLLVARVLDSKGLGRMSDVMAGLLWALTREARVINLSLGTETPGRPGDALAWAVDEVVERGVTVCAAAAAHADGGFNSPATSALALRVEAYDSGAEPAEPETAPVASSAEAVLAAPGVGVVAARAHGTCIGREQGESYVQASGSSAAAAHVAGVCALLLEAVPDATPENLRRALRVSGRPLGEQRSALNALAALAELRAPARRGASAVPDP